VTVAVLTPAIPDRLDDLSDCVRSVAAQTTPVAQHLIHLDYERAGCAEAQNRLLAACTADWFTLLADDDRLLPYHVATLLEHTDKADIVYSPPLVEGRPGFHPSADPFDEARLRAGNYIASTCLIRTRLAKELDGWRTDAAHGFEDWDFWLRALDHGARFQHVPKPTWVYRFTGSNMSLGWAPDAWEGQSAARGVAGPENMVTTVGRAVG